MCKPYIDSPGDYGVAEDIAFNLYAMDCEGMLGADTINVNVNIDPTNFTKDDIESIVKEIERLYAD